MRFLPDVLTLTLRCSSEKASSTRPRSHRLAGSFSRRKLHTKENGVGLIGIGGSSAQRPNRSIASSITSGVIVASRLVCASSAGICEKFGSDAPMVRFRRCSSVALSTTLRTPSPSCTWMCGHRDHAAAPHDAIAGCPLRANVTECSSPAGARWTPSGVANGGGDQREVDVAVGDRGHRLAVGGQPFHPDARRAPLYFGDRAGQQRRREVRNRESEHPRARRGIERLGRRDDTLDAAQDGPHVLDELSREGARRHPAPDLDEERVPDLVAQARERMADRRRRPSQPRGCPRHASLGHQNFEGDEEVQVEPTQFDFAHDV